VAAADEHPAINAASRIETMGRIERFIASPFHPERPGRANSGHCAAAG
jgi:hypothetical protein